MDDNEPPSKWEQPGPSTLCGRNIEHWFKEADSSLTWYTGSIVKQIGNKSSWELLIYDDEEGEYHFNFENNIDTGDIWFVVYTHYFITLTDTQMLYIAISYMKSSSVTSDTNECGPSLHEQAHHTWERIVNKWSSYISLQEAV